MIPYHENRLNEMTRLDNYDPVAAARNMKNVWELLEERDRELFISTLKVERYKKNELIYHEGDLPERLLCLHSGKVKIFRDGVGGRFLINRVLRPIQYFGYRASMANEPYVTAAAAFEESTIISVPMKVVYDVLNTNARLAMFFIRDLATDLGTADKRIVSITQKHVRGRLAEALLSLLDIYGVDSDGQTLDLHISREDLANLSNMTTSNAIRTLSIFADEGLLEVRGRYIKFLDVKALQRISENG